MKNIEDRASFEFIRYANCWEDPLVLLGGLEVAEGDRVLSVASAGDNSFALLLDDPQMVVAADISAAQIALCDLKRAAFVELEYPEMIRFLGFRSSEGRWSTYQRLRPMLGDASRKFWDDARMAIERGVIHSGKFEHYFHVFRELVLPLVHSRATVDDLMREKSAEERAEFYTSRWDTPAWRLMFRVFFSRWALGRLGRDPEFFRYVQGNVAGRILERARQALTTLPTHTNPFLSYIVYGTFAAERPLYAREEHFQTIRTRLDRLHLFYGGLSEAAEYYGGGFNRFNLSDVFEYMDSEHFADQSRLLLSAAAPGARFAYWNMLAPRRMSDVAAGLEPLRELAQSLFAQDRAFFYSNLHLERITNW